MLLLTPMITRIFHERCWWLAWRVWWYALASVTHEITWPQNPHSQAIMNDLEDIVYDQRSLHATHPIMLVSICAKYSKNPSRTVCAVERTWQDVTSGLDLNFQGHMSRRTSEIDNLPVLHEITPVRAIIYVIIFPIIDLCCRTSVIIIQPVQGAIFQNFCLSGTVGQSLRSRP